VPSDGCKAFRVSNLGSGLYSLGLDFRGVEGLESRVQVFEFQVQGVSHKKGLQVCNKGRRVHGFRF